MLRRVGRKIGWPGRRRDQDDADGGDDAAGLPDQWADAPLGEARVHDQQGGVVEPDELDGVRKALRLAIDPEVM